MNGRREKQQPLGGRPRAREPIDIPEDQRPDKSIDILLKVRKNRVARFEGERLQAREEWRAARARLNAAKWRWREAVAAAREEWQQARTQFFQMTTTSGQFRRAKAVYERMKASASQLLLEARELAQSCRVAREGFFQATRRLAQMRRQQEKLSILRDEMREMDKRSLE